MKRQAINQLLEWKNSDDRKPLVLKGARQVGKTWLMKEFAKQYYEDAFYFNFDEDDELKSVFEMNKDAHRIVEVLGMIKGQKDITRKTSDYFR